MSVLASAPPLTSEACRLRRRATIHTLTCGANEACQRLAPPPGVLSGKWKVPALVQLCTWYDGRVSSLQATLISSVFGLHFISFFLSAFTVVLVSAHFDSPPPKKLLYLSRVRHLSGAGCVKSPCRYLVRGKSFHRRNTTQERGRPHFHSPAPHVPLTANPTRSPPGSRQPNKSQLMSAVCTPGTMVAQTTTGLRHVHETRCGPFVPSSGSPSAREAAH
jgi:hypothetical protein